MLCFLFPYCFFGREIKNKVPWVIGNFPTLDILMKKTAKEIYDRAKIFYFKEVANKLLNIMKQIKYL